MVAYHLARVDARVGFLLPAPDAVGGTLLEKLITISMQFNESAVVCTACCDRDSVSLILIGYPKLSIFV